MRLVSRWIEIPGGVLLAFWTLLATAGAIATLVAPPSQHRLLMLTVGIFMLLLSGWCLDKTVRLITGRSSDGDLLSPLALKTIAVIAFLLPFGGLFTGYYSTQRSLAITQAATYFAIAVALFRLAKSRQDPGDRTGA